MKLIPISEHPDAARILYDLLAERPAYANISHRAMPTWEEHRAFVETRDPMHGGEYSYREWFLIQAGDIVGQVYLTERFEIGIQIRREYQGRGLGSHAVKMLMQIETWPRYLANVAPGNESSRKMFEKLGFRTIQHTLALDAD